VEDRPVAVEMADVSVAYEGVKTGRVEAVRRFSLTVHHNEVVCLVGPSGCGKTSLLRAVAGLLPLHEGTVDIHAMEDQPPIAVIFQSPSLFPWRTALDNAAYGVECITKDKKLARQKALRALELVGLGAQADYYPSQLSGGMQQRVNVARAIALEPALLLLDEPFASLDAQLRERLQAELLRILAATNATALFVTHQVEEAVYLADRVAVMQARPGRLRSVIDVDLDKSSTLDVMRSKDFLNICDTVREQLGDVPGEMVTQT
jgi:NitT/TauT family transport system ATP-binding protein